MAQFNPVAKRSIKADYLVVENIQALLTARRVDAKALAMWCGHKPAWISKILSRHRGISLSDLDKVADFFGLTCAQLLQHGISALCERRKSQRRAKEERRTAERRQSGEEDRVHGRMPPFLPRGIPRYAIDDAAYGQCHWGDLDYQPSLPA